MKVWHFERDSVKANGFCCRLKGGGGVISIIILYLGCSSFDFFVFFSKGCPPEAPNLLNFPVGVACFDDSTCRDLQSNARCLRPSSPEKAPWGWGGSDDGKACCY